MLPTLTGTAGEWTGHQTRPWLSRTVSDDPYSIAPCKETHITHLYCWWSLVLLVLAMKRSASFSKLREYSISISDFLRKKSWRSCRSWTLISVCCSRHFCCSTSWARISGEKTNKQEQPNRSVKEQKLNTSSAKLWCYIVIAVQAQFYNLGLRAKNKCSAQSWQALQVVHVPPWQHFISSLALHYGWVLLQPEQWMFSDPN